jgi:hypothetical protein
MTTTPENPLPVKPKLVLKPSSGKLLYLKKSSPAPQLSAKATAIAKLIAEAQSYEHEGFAWAKGSQEWWTSKLGFSVETFRRIIGKPPFVRDRIIDPETSRQVTLVRIGKPGQKTKRQLQNIMSAIWRKKLGRPLEKKQYGHLAGLVDHWGHDKAIDIFKLVLSEWSRFKVGAKFEIDKLGDEGYHRYQTYPSTSFMLKFWTVGVEMYVMDQQANPSKDAPVPF